MIHGFGIFRHFPDAEHEERWKAQYGRENKGKKYRGSVVVRRAKPQTSVRMPKQKRPTLPNNNSWKLIVQKPLISFCGYLLDRNISPHSQRHGEKDGNCVEDLREVHMEEQIDHPHVSKIWLSWEEKKEREIVSADNLR